MSIVIKQNNGEDFLKKILMKLTVVLLEFKFLSMGVKSFNFKFLNIYDFMNKTGFFWTLFIKFSSLITMS